MFVPILLTLTAIWHLNDATSCTAVTGRTCTKSKFVTGTCSNDICACVNDYEPAHTGCIVKVKPSVDIIATDGGNPEQTAKGSGDVFLTGEIKLLCLHVGKGFDYIWSKDSVDLLDQPSNNVLSLSKVNSNVSGQYRCKAKLASSDYVSEASDPVTIKAISGDGTVSVKPVVTPVYKRSITDVTITYNCTSIPSGVALTYEWYVAGVKTNSQTQQYDMNMTDKTLSQNITCKVISNDRLGNIKFTSLESAPVFTPSSLTGDVMGKVVAVPSSPTPIIGGYLSIQCNAEVKNLNRVTYTWTKDYVLIDGQTDRLIQINGVSLSDSGTYQCEAFSDLVHNKSSTFVSEPKAIATITPEAPFASNPSTDFFGLGNTYTLTCNNTYETPGMTYEWMRDNQTVSGATSKTYSMTVTSGTVLYKCRAFFNGSWSSASPELKVVAKKMTRITIVLAGTTVTNSTIMPLTDAEVILECKVTKALGTTGEITYAWLKSGESQNSSTYNFNASAPGTFTCNAKMGIEIMTAYVTVAFVATLKPPDVAIGTSVYVEGASYIMYCITTSHTGGVQYAWLKDNTLLAGATARENKISNARKGPGGDSGVYTCTATLGKSSVKSTNSITVNITDAGRPCKYGTDCTGVQYTSNCLNDRCECAGRYTVKGDTCTSGVANRAVSLLLLVLSVTIRWA